MRRIKKPSDKAEDVFKLCISVVRNPALKKRLASCEKDIVAAAAEFQLRATVHQLHRIKPIKKFSANISGKQMVRVYTNRMAKKASPGRPFYDTIISSAPQGICPLCGQRIASTIDHYLTKATYPLFSVVPINLVPACKDCNFAKNAFPDPISSDQETMHPYFDDVESDQWLVAEVIEGASPTLSFKVDAPAKWDAVLKERLTYHFKVFDLAKLFATHSAAELLNIKYSLVNLFNAGGTLAIQQHLEGEARSRSVVYKNSWQTAMYGALASSNWFCSGGLKLI